MKIKRIKYLDEDSELDELLINSVKTVHIERMSNGHIWMSFASDDEEIHLNFTTNRNAKIFASVM